jgi:hypothetical protein
VTLAKRLSCISDGTVKKTELISDGRLEELREQERESAFFTEMPAAHIFETANIILG